MPRTAASGRPFQHRAGRGLVHRLQSRRAVHAGARTDGPAQELVGGFDTLGDQQRRLTLVSLDNALGVYAAYSPEGKHVRLIAYGGASIPVADLKDVPPVETDVATGPDGRVGVMWGDWQAPNDSSVGRIAVTRSNMARARFEPVQVFDTLPGTLWRLCGDGRLGPLALLANLTPRASPAGATGIFYSHMLPVLSAKLAVKEVKRAPTGLARG